MTYANFSNPSRQFTDAPIVFSAYMPLKQHSEPEDGAIEEEGKLEDYVLSDDLDWERDDD